MRRSTSKAIQFVLSGRASEDRADLTDAQLLGCFVEHRDEAAFAILLKRHGPLIWGVCRRTLDHCDAEDAFQATFLVLVKKAAAVAPREMLANWLHGVALRATMEAKRKAARRRERETPVASTPEPQVTKDEPRNDLRQLLDQELGYLPAKYRGVIVMCDLEGQTRSEAAKQLGCPEGTVAGRLARARTLLARRLTRRGIALSSGALAAELSAKLATASVPDSLIALTIKVVNLAASGRTATEAIAANVNHVTEGVLRAMRLTKLKMAGALLAITGIVVLGGGIAAHTMVAGEPQKTEKAPVDEKKSPAADLKEKADPVEGKLDDLEKRIREMQKERIETLRKLVQSATLLFQNGAQGTDYEDVIKSQVELLNAELEIADKPSDRVAIFEKRVELLKKNEQHVKTRIAAARATQIPLLKARAELLHTEMGLERAKAAEKKVDVPEKNIREMQKERIEILKKLVDSNSKLFANRAPGIESKAVMKAQVELTNALLEIADKPADRVDIYEKRLKLLKEMEQLANAAIEAARGTQLSLLATQAALIEAEIGLERAKVAAAKDRKTPPAEIKAEEFEKRIREMQKKRLEILKQAAEHAMKNSRNLQGTQDEEIEAQLNYFNAELELADKFSDRVAICERRVKVLSDVEKIAKVKTNNARGTLFHVLQAQAARIQAEIDLERAKAAAAKDRK